MFVSVLATGCGDTAKDPYVAANARLLQLAKPYPGAKLDRVKSSPYTAPDTDYGPIIGYTTVAYYSLLTKPTHGDAIASFYARELRGWREKIVTLPCRTAKPPPGAPSGPSDCARVTDVSFTKGSPLIQVQGLIQNQHLDKSTYYSVAIDSEYAKNAH